MLRAKDSAAHRRPSRSASVCGCFRPGEPQRPERETAELVAQGRTNREIASELFLSETTIESQLSRVFATLGVSGACALRGVTGENARVTIER